MGTVHAAVTCSGTVHEAESVWCNTGRWQAWVEGLQTLVSVTDDWPAAGAEVRWASNPAGRGAVSERVLRHEPLSMIESEIEDDQAIARQVTRFLPLQDGVEVSLDFAYRIKRRSPLTPVVDFLFVRRAMEASLQQTLARFAAEVDAAR